MKLFSLIYRKWNSRIVHDQENIKLALGKRAHPPYIPFSRGNMSQVIFRSTPTLYISQGDQATANSTAGVCSLSVGYPRGTHSSHMNGCCLIPLGYVQRGSRSKNNLRHLTNGKGYVWGIWSLPPLFSLGMTYPLDKVIWRLKNWEQDFHSSLSSSSLMLRANKFMLIVKC